MGSIFYFWQSKQIGGIFLIYFSGPNKIGVQYIWFLGPFLYFGGFQKQFVFNIFIFVVQKKLESNFFGGGPKNWGSNFLEVPKKLGDNILFLGSKKILGQYVYFILGVQKKLGSNFYFWRRKKNVSKFFILGVQKNLRVNFLFILGSK